MYQIGYNYTIQRHKRKTKWKTLITDGQITQRGELT